MIWSLRGLLRSVPQLVNLARMPVMPPIVPSQVAAPPNQLIPALDDGAGNRASLVLYAIAFLLIAGLGLACTEILYMEGRYTAALHKYLGKDVGHVIEKDMVVRDLSDFTAGIPLHEFCERELPDCEDRTMLDLEGRFGWPRRKTPRSSTRATSSRMARRALPAPRAERTAWQRWSLCSLFTVLATSRRLLPLALPGHHHRK